MVEKTDFSMQKRGNALIRIRAQMLYKNQQTTIMNKNVKPIKKKINAPNKKSKLNDIRPFTEQPSGNRMNGGIKDKTTLGAADLFSHFTADIIKENTLFTR